MTNPAADPFFTIRVYPDRKDLVDPEGRRVIKLLDGAWHWVDTGAAIPDDDELLDWPWPVQSLDEVARSAGHPTPTDERDELIDLAWGLIANVGDGNGEWSSQTQEWQDAAARWRDRYLNPAAPVEDTHEAGIYTVYRASDGRITGLTNVAEPAPATVDSAQQWQDMYDKVMANPVLRKKIEDFLAEAETEPARDDHGLEEHRDAVTVFLTAPGINRRDSTAIAEDAVGQTLTYASSSTGEIHARTPDGRTFPARVHAVHDTSRAISDDYLRLEPTSKAYSPAQGKPTSDTTP